MQFKVKAYIRVLATSSADNKGVIFLMDMIANYFPSAAMQESIVATKPDGEEIELAL